MGARKRESQGHGLKTLDVAIRGQAAALVLSTIAKAIEAELATEATYSPVGRESGTPRRRRDARKKAT